MAKKEPKLPQKKTPKLIKVFTLTNEEAKELYSVIKDEHLPHDKPHYTAMVYRLGRFITSLNESTNESVDSLGTQKSQSNEPISASVDDDKPPKDTDTDH